VLKNRVGESWCQNHLADQQVYQLLEKVDVDLTEEARQQGCARCGGKLHRSDYDRKPRGGPQWELRFTLCCAREGCRRRHSPPSVRFMGRRVYAGLVVVLVSAMLHGLNPERVQRFASLIAKETGVPEVERPVNLPLLRDLRRERMLKAKVAWCPRCLSDWSGRNLPIYRPLLWSMQWVRFCPTHHVVLTERCPSRLLKYSQKDA
jgi:TniQ